jgi:hypothetical protein
MKHFGLRITGLLLFLLAIIGLIATTLLSISGGASEYTNINKLFNGQIKDYLGVFRLSGFIVGTIFIQLMIFAVSSIESFIKIKFCRHYIKVLLLQYGLLIVSIYYNYMFFGHNSMIKLLLCILLDLAVIKLVSLSMDLMTLNYSLANKKESTNSIFKMWIDNKLFGLKNEIIQTYNSNNKLDLKNDNTDIEVLESDLEIEVLESDLESDLEDQKLLRTGEDIGNSNVIEFSRHSQDTSQDSEDTENEVESYIKDIKTGQKINVKEIRELLKLNERSWRKFRDNSNLLEIRNGFTYKK